MLSGWILRVCRVDKADSVILLQIDVLIRANGMYWVQIRAYRDECVLLPFSPPTLHRSHHSPLFLSLNYLPPVIHYLLIYIPLHNHSIELVLSALLPIFRFKPSETAVEWHLSLTQAPHVATKDGSRVPGLPLIVEVIEE